jgi:hypothetical protein
MVKNEFHRLIIESNTPRIHLACYDAVRSWHNDIVKFKSFTRSALECKIEFSEFLKCWQVSRSAKISDRARIRLALKNLRDEIDAPSQLNHRWVQVEQAVGKISAASSESSRCTSLASKFAFCHSPKLFSPYDSFTVRAIRSFGIKIKDHAYVDFMSAFEEIFVIFSRLFKEHDKPWEKYLEPFNLELSDIEKELFTRRVTDKFLMLMGGYGDISMYENVCDGLTNTQRSDTYATISGKL